MLTASLLLTAELAAGAFVGAFHAPSRAASAPLSASMVLAPFDGESMVSVPPGVLKTNSRGAPWVEQRARPRRNRKSETMRRMVRENQLSPADFIYPLFIHEDNSNVLIASMPGCERHSLASMVAEAKDAWQYGVRSFVVFPKVDDALKSNRGEEAYNPSGIVPRAVAMLKDALPDSIVCTDVALDPYSSKGHDGIVENGKILNDATIEQLCKQSVMQAKAGSDIVAPSDMMDGRVGAIRDALDSEGFTEVSILAYTAKYASAYYGPFRDALDSHPGFGDKKTYQQDPANGREALLEARLDELEGADMLMVKPGLPYLDVILRLRQESSLPIAAYHVSGEYSMLKAAAERGWLDERKVALETLTCFKRAGADVILTYYAKQASKWLVEDGMLG
ncbi:hypothetical protein AB1Y20_021214 [Prymnesium parvum]|uniref:Delta-aminolevulinic acid dehydratase n=1 Tax=Prymnesium parvum TaxID=97485 RepID=A0AB34JJ04_PRYPA